MLKTNNINYDKISFKAGLTTQMKYEINNCNADKVSNVLKNINIDSDFKENKVIAWCTLKCIELITAFNKKYGLNLTLPKGIFVENFNNLNIKQKNAFGFMNFAPTFLHTDKEIITPEKTIFFNEFSEMNYTGGNVIWEQIDKIADINFNNGAATTDFFLETFLHEFAHTIHEGNMIAKIRDSSDLIKIIFAMLKNENPLFQNLQSEIAEKICQYATTNQLEMIACDVTKQILNNISKDTLQPVNNFTTNSPYKKHCFLNILYNNKNALGTLLKNTWNGKITHLKTRFMQ